MKSDGKTTRHPWTRAVNRLLWAPGLALCLLQLIGIEMVLTAFFAFFSIALVVGVWSIAGFKGVPARQTWRHFVGSVVLLIVVTLGLPMRAVFILSKPSLEAIADRLEQGEAIDTPVFAGLVRVRGTRNWSGTPCIWSTRYQSGSVGYCRYTDDDRDPYHDGFFVFSLGDDWYYFYEE